VWTMQDAGKSHVPPPQVFERVLGQCQMETAMGGSGNISTGSLAAVYC
jgi:hypothetical protein